MLEQVDNAMSSPLSSPSPSPPPASQPVVRNGEPGYVLTIAKLSKQIADLQLSFAASEEERKKLQQQLNTINEASTNAARNTINEASTNAARNTINDASTNAASNTINAAANNIFIAATSSKAIATCTTATSASAIRASTSFANAFHVISSSSIAPTAAAPVTTAATAFNIDASLSSPHHFQYAPPYKTTCAQGQVSTYLPGMYNNTFSTSNATFAYDPHNFANSLPVHLPTTIPPSPLYKPIRKCQDLPEFSGQPEQWPMFFVAFKETSAAHGYTDLENLSRLQKALRGDAKRMVEALLIHPNSIGAIMSTLEFHYGRPELLIRSQLAKVKSFPMIHESRINEVINYSVMVSNLTVFLENVSASAHLSNPTLLDELVSKLPLNKREEWARHTISIMPLYPSIREFNNWLKQVATYIAIATEITTSSISALPTTNEKRSRHVNVVCAVTGEQRTKLKCTACSADHHLYQCSAFRSSTTDERWKLVKTNRICFCCLRSGHVVAKCPYRRECGISACRKNHNRLLHDNSERKFVAPLNNNSLAPSNGGKQINMNSKSNSAAVATVNSVGDSDGPSQENINENTVVSAIENKHTNKKTLFKFLPVQLNGPLGSCVVIAFIDEGAKVSLIEERVAQTIGVRGASDLLSLRWIADQTTSELSQHVDLEIAGVYNNAIKYQMRDVRTTKNLLLPSQTLNLKEFKKQYAELGKILIEDYVDAIPQILISVPHTNLTRPTDILNIDNGFAVHNTKLGWTLFGSNEDSYSDAVVSYIDLEESELDNLHRQVAEYFTMDNFEIRPSKLVVSEHDKRAEIMLKETTKKVNSQYETGLLWKTENVTFSESYSMALKRICTVEDKMFKNSEFAQWYKSKVKEYIDKSYARKLLPEEIACTNRTWYLPHFAVCNINKGNKLRLVFDAAAEANGMSLNSMLLKGPDAYQPKSLLSILFGFRQRKIGVCGDIREMFLRVNIKKEDQNAQKFLWRDGDRSRSPDMYVMSAMIFGSKSSPCSAQYIKNLNASAYKDTHPRAVRAIVDCHYVDDYVDSFDRVEDAIEVVKNIRTIHSHAGFEIRDFVSNSFELLEALSNKSIDTTLPDIKNICQRDLCTEKILGMYWDSKSDMFCFVLKFGRMPEAVLNGTVRPTKSQVLSITMSIFDPFGFLANVTIMSKLLIQKLWKANVGWNELIPEDIYTKWYKWYKQLESVKEFKIPRCYHLHFTNTDADVQLHIFVDASEVAFSAVGYWRVTSNNDVSLHYVMRKTRCSPLKALSIPRLELQAAVLGVRLKDAIVNSHEVKPSQITLWSDSKTVIHWIRSDSRCYKQFVAHRIAEILDGSDVKNWKWVPAKQNPADDATRPQTVLGASTKSAWITGPSFLKGPEKNWPKLPDDIKAHEQTVERRQHFILSVAQESSIIRFENFSCYYKLLKVVCWMKRAVQKFKELRKIKDTPEVTSLTMSLSVNELRQAEVLLCRLVQEAAYPNEMRLLLLKRAVPKTSVLFKLTPVLGEGNILRLGGRLDNATCLPYNTKRPIILPKYHMFSKLLVRYYHEMYRHQNQEAIVCAIRAKFWIPSIRRLVRSAKLSCQICKNRSAVPVPPLMGQLPSDRLIPYVRPFSYTGVDYIGPFQITIGRRREKRWVAIFTCLSVRAIHLEVARDLSSDAAILCLRNFVNRRGTPVRLRSDCGTNFVGASKEEWIVIGNSIEKECTRRGIEWLFNPAGNPSAGGVWERLVRCVKSVLCFSLKEKAPQIETLQSLLIEAENLVNSRPLTHLPLESDEAEPLTPNHFLLGCPNYIPTSAVDENKCLRKQWHILQQLKQTFWRRWVLEYLPTLTRRTKWYQRVQPLQVGDFVIICDDNESRGEWKRGKVVKVFPAPDGQVRSAVVQTTSGNLKRPASKLAKLDILGESHSSIHGGRDVTA